MDSGSEAAEPQRISHYRLLHPLGAGGMGEVFAAFDETLKRRVAIKAIHARQLITADAKARFLREAQILSRLDHPHICRVHDYLSEGGREFLVLELIEGKSLRTAIQAGLDRAAILKIAQQVADVLVVTHAAGIVHRDLKPGNIMLTARGDVKVLDFGLARSVGVESPEPPAILALSPTSGDDETVGLDEIDRTRTVAGEITGWSALPTGAGADFKSHTGSISGTIAYMSPEQAIGESPAAPSDLYSFGLILQEMISGEPAFDKKLDHHALLEAVRRGHTRPPSGADADFTALINRLTTFAPTQRPTAVELSDRLRWIAGKPARRIRRLAIAATLVAIVLAAAKYTIDLGRERDDADRRRGQAESLIGFMLGDLRPKLQQVGRLDLLDSVGQEATKYFNTVPAGTLTSEELHRRSQALYQIGQVRQAAGKLADAVAAYRESLAVAEQVARRDPSNSDWQLGLAMAHFYLGDALRVQGDLDGAMREFSAYRDVARGLVTRDPQNEKFRLELAYGHGNVAAALEAKGDLDGARRELEFAQRIKEDLARLKPDDVERQDALATGHNRLGTVLDSAGEAPAAQQHFLSDLAIRRSLAERNPLNYALRRQHYVATTFVARAYQEQGDTAAALQHYRDGLAIAEASAAIDRANLDWQRDLGRIQAVLADTLQWQDALAEAQALYGSSLSILRPIAQGAPTNVARQRDLANTEIGAGWLAMRQGDAKTAAAHAAAAYQALAGQVGKGSDRVSARIAAESHLLAAQAADQQGRPDEGREFREAALKLVPIGSGPVQKRVAAVAVCALLGLDRSEDSKPLVERLTRLGYRHPAFVQTLTAGRTIGPP